MLPRLNSYTSIIVFLHVFLIPIVYFKAYIGPIPLSIEVILIPLLVLVAFYEYRQKKIKLNDFNIWTFMIAFLLFFIVSAISLVNAVNLVVGVMEMARYASYAILFFIMTKVVFDKKEYMLFAKAFFISTTLIVIYGTIQYIFNFGLNIAGVYALDEAYGRVESTMVNPNYYAAFINFVLPGFLLITVVYFQKKRYQLLSFLVFGLLVANMVLTYTRVAWIIMFGALLLILLLSGKDFLKKLVKPHLLVAIAILSIVIYQMPDFQARSVSAIYAAENMIFGTAIFGSEEDEVQEELIPEEVEEEDDIKKQEKEKDEMTERAMVSRVTLWKTGWVMFQDNPVLGVGVGNYLDRYSDYVEIHPELFLGHDRYSVHNSYLKVMAETGIIGIFTFMLVYFLYYYHLVRFYFTQDKVGKLVAVALLIGSITFILQNTSNNLIFIPQMNIIFWMVSGLVFNYLHQRNSHKL
jgi:putative inorganic carbon (HCO3(-)) transporter